MRRRAVLLCALLSATGCVALPVASPPVQVNLGVGVRSLSSEANGRTVDTTGQVRAGIHPLGLFPDYLGRRADVGVGYLLDFGPGGTMQGGYLEGSGVVLQHIVGSGLGKLSVRAQARLVQLTPENVWGQSGALAVGWEFVTFSDSDFTSQTQDGGMIGHSYGETGVGVLLEGAYLRAGTVTGWTGSVCLIARLPASFGIAYVWAWALKK